MTQAYLFAGAAGSGRRDVMADLVTWSARNPAEGRKFAVLLPKGELGSGVVSFGDAVFVGEWDGTGDAAAIPEWPAETDTVFVLLDGSADPVDQMENLSEWFRSRPDVELARIITVLNSRLLFEKPSLKLWFDACIHFSDVVLLNQREGVPNKWFSDLKLRFAKECFPCLFDLVKSGKVRNPAEILFPEARRMSQAFEVSEADEVALPELKDVEYEIVDETEDEDDGVAVDEDEDDRIEPEPYFERDAAGRRKIRLPDIRDYVS